MALALALLAVVLAVLVWPWSERAGAVGAHPSGGSLGADEVAVGPGSPLGLIEPSTSGETVTVDEAAAALVLCGLALRAGLAPVEALEAVARRLHGPTGRQLLVVATAHRWGQDAATAWSHVGDAWRPAAIAWQAAERSGAAPAAVVMAAADRMRRQESARVEAAVQRAGVLLVLPLGACFLPGFIGTTVVPVVLHLARSSLGAP